MKRLAGKVLVVIFLAIPFASNARDADANVRICKLDLRKGGEIPAWLALGYIDLPKKDKEEDIIASDLLSQSGGEAVLNPLSSETVRIGEKSFSWSLAQPKTPSVINFARKYDRFILFVTPDGRELSKTAIYFFTTIVSPKDQEVKFLLGTDDAVKVFLNEKELHRFCARRGVSDDVDSVLLPLKAGKNNLLVRIDNYAGSGGFVGRIVRKENDFPATDITCELPVTAGNSSPLYLPLDPNLSWKETVELAPGLKPSADEVCFGAHLGRTMSLLETGKFTGRPIRIVFWGQSITAQGWTGQLVKQLRDRFPGTEIQAENWCIGGWEMPCLIKTIEHNILRSRPDLIFFSVYGGTMDQWDRAISMIRSETCAEIIMRSPHIHVIQPPNTRENTYDYGTILRAVAKKHGCEFVECAAEWSEYLDQNKLEAKELLCDSVHLNGKGSSLMAQLHERHLRRNPLAASWEETVQWFGARRPFENKKSDQIMLEGEWIDHSRYVESSRPDSSLSLKFTGNRIDAALGYGSGSANVLIDGQPVSKLKLFRAEFFKTNSSPDIKPPVLRRYVLGENLLEEKWTLKFTEWNANRSKFKFELSGSVTGSDGKGESGRDFVSNSGRIKIYRDDWSGVWPVIQVEPGIDLNKFESAPENAWITWLIASNSADRIKTPPEEPAGIRPVSVNPPYYWLTIADGLPYGAHAIKIIPASDGPFRLLGLEVFSPPLAQ